MEKLGYYLKKILDWIKEFWKFLFEDTEKIQAHHLLALLLTIATIYILSFIVTKIFKVVLKICVLIAVVWLLIMLLFARGKFKELFG